MESSSMANQIRVLVANHPRLLRELILTTFADQPDNEIVGEIDEEAAIPETVKKTLPDFLVIAQDNPNSRPNVCDIVLREHPLLRIIAVAPDENYSVHYWALVEIRSNNIEASEEGILGTLRSSPRFNGGMQ
jgi:hypothetical protein